MPKKGAVGEQGGEKAITESEPQTLAAGETTPTRLRAAAKITGSGRNDPAGVVQHAAHPGSGQWEIKVNVFQIRDMYICIYMYMCIYIYIYIYNIYIFVHVYHIEVVKKRETRGN